MFADFEVNDAGRAYVVRISYDGYGCCHPHFGPRGGRMPKPDSEVLLDAVERDRLDTDAVETILSAYFEEHQKSLWSDALTRHGLIRGES